MIPTPGGAIDDGRYLAFPRLLSYRVQRSEVEISRCGQARLPFAARPLGCARGDKRKAPWPLVEMAMPGRDQNPPAYSDRTGNTVVASLRLPWSIVRD